MQRLEVVLTASAYDDLDRITDYLIERDAAAAEKTYRRIMDSAKKLGAFPQMGMLIEDGELRFFGHRKLITDDYVVVYRVFEESVVVYHVFNYRQDYGKVFLPRGKER